MLKKRDLRHSIANINLHRSHKEHFCASSFRLRDINILTFWPWQFRSSSRSTKTGLTPFDSECQSSCIKVIRSTFALALTVCKILLIKTFGLEYISQGHDVQNLQWRHSMANVNLYKTRTWAFFASFHRFPDIIIILLYNILLYIMISRNFVTLKL